jgi:hypothetical protein
VEFELEPSLTQRSRSIEEPKDPLVSLDPAKEPETERLPRTLRPRLRKFPRVDAQRDVNNGARHVTLMS